MLADVDILYKPMSTELLDSSIDKEDNGRVSTKKLVKIKFYKPVSWNYHNIIEYICLRA